MSPYFKTERAVSWFYVRTHLKVARSCWRTRAGFSNGTRLAWGHLREALYSLWLYLVGRAV